jgi:hypothetical protein
MRPYRRRKGRQPKFGSKTVNGTGTWDTANPQVIKTPRQPAPGFMQEAKARARYVDVERLERLFPTRFKGTPPGRVEAEALIIKLQGTEVILHQTEKRVVILYIMREFSYVVYLDGLFGEMKKSITYGSPKMAKAQWEAGTIRWKEIIEFAAAPSPSSA